MSVSQSVSAIVNSLREEDDDDDEAEGEGDQISCQERESCKNGVNDSRAPLLALGHTHSAHLRARERGSLRAGHTYEIPTKLKKYRVRNKMSKSIKIKTAKSEDTT